MVPLFLFPLSGCSKTKTVLVRDYAYDSPEKAYEWGGVRAVITGLYSEVGPDTRMRGAPYDFSVRIKVKPGFMMTGNAVIENLVIADNEDGSEKYRGEEAIRKEGYLTQMPGEGGEEIFFLITFLVPQRLDEYARYRVSFDFRLMGEGFSFRDRVEFVFEKQYEERRETVFL